jgi:hypothetical protein
LACRAHCILGVMRDSDGSWDFSLMKRSDGSVVLFLAVEQKPMKNGRQLGMGSIPVSNRAMSLFLELSLWPFHLRILHQRGAKQAFKQ